MGSRMGSVASQTVITKDRRMNSEIMRAPNYRSAVTSNGAGILNGEKLLNFHFFVEMLMNNAFRHHCIG